MKLQTERLILRPFTLADTTFIITLLNSEGWLKYVGDRNVKTFTDAASYLLNGPLKSYTDNGFGLSAVEMRNSGELIGMCGLIKRDSLEHVDIGFAFLPEHQGKGYAAEIADACLSYAFRQLNLEKVVAITLPANKSSIALLEKLGMRLQGTVNLPNDPEKLALFSTTSRSDMRPPFFDFPVLGNTRILLREILPHEAEKAVGIITYDQRTAATIAEAEKKLRKVDFNYRQGNGINWGIFERTSQELIGTIGYYRGFNNETGEIGFVIREKSRRMGYGKDALELLIHFGLDIMKLKRITAFTKPDNIPSQQLLQKCGFHKTGKMETEYLEFEYLG